MAGGVIVTVLFAGGTALTIGRLEAIAATQIETLRREEAQITLAERLRFSGEVIVSAGRGYVITGDPSLREKLFETRARFAEIDRTLRMSRSPQSAILVAEIERAAGAFMSAQTQLVSDRSRGERDGLARFEELLLPLQRELGTSLDKLVEQKEAALDSIYRQAARERERIELSLYALATALVLGGLGVTWYFGGQTARAYRKEQRALEVAHQALAARDELLGVLAHDLRNPLGAIMMHARRIRGTDAASAGTGAGSIERIAGDMESLISGMLDATMIEAGRFPVLPAPCKAARLVDQSLEMLAELAASRGVRLRRGVFDGDVTLAADQGRVLQLLSNIVGNAIKFTPPDGEVTLSMLRRGDKVLFAVADDGPGIAPEHLPHVFDRFWRKDESRGTGLGLFICKQIVETHGGEIWVESTPGDGSTFYFTLRADHGRPPAHSSTVNASSTLPGRPTNPASPDST